MNSFSDLVSDLGLVLPADVPGWAGELSGPAGPAGEFMATSVCPSHPPISIKVKLDGTDCDTEICVSGRPVGGAVKALGNGKIGGYLVRFTDETKPDLTGDYFTAETELGMNSPLPVFYQHGQDVVIGKSVLGAAVVKRDEIGLWVDAQLQLRDEYQAAIYKLAEAGKLGWSSGAVAHLVERKAVGSANWLKTWWIAEASLTPSPAEPMNDALVAAEAAIEAEVEEAFAPHLKATVVPAWMRANAKRGLVWYKDGYAGDGVTDKTVQEARAMAAGSVSAGKAKRMAAWFARHMVDLSAPAARVGADGYPSAGVVAHALWGGGSRTDSKRAMAWAGVRAGDGKAAALDDEPGGNDFEFEKLEDMVVDTIVAEIVDDGAVAKRADAEGAARARLDVDGLKAQIAALTARLDAPVFEGGKMAPVLKGLGGDHDGGQAFKHWIRTGVMNSYTKNNEQDWSSTKTNALNETTTTEGGILVPEGLHQMIIAKRDEMSVIRANGAMIITTNLDTVQVPVENARMTTAIVAESGSYVAAEPTFTSNSVPVYKFGNQLRLTDELLSDEQTNLMPYLSNGLGRAFGLMENQYCIAGTGSSQPKGLITGGTAAVTAASTTAITAAELVSLYHKLPEPYTTSPSEVVFITQNGTLGALRALASSSVFTFNLQPQGDQGAQQLYGHKVAVSGYMQAPTTGLKSLLVTNLAAGYILIQRSGIVMSRNPWLLQATGQVALFTTMRFGGTTTVAEATQILTQA